MLAHRHDLGLSVAQAQELERLRADYQREAVKRDADQRIAEMDVAALLKSEPVDLARVEARVREAERARADQRLSRIRVIEQAKAQLTPEQREKLASLLGDTPAPRPRAGDRQPPRASAPSQRL